MGAPASMGSDKSDMGSNVKVVGLLGFGATLMLLGFTLLPPPYSNGFAGFGPAMATALFFGGILTAIAGLMALKRGHLFWGSAFAAFGAFFVAWTFTVGLAGASFGLFTLPGASGYGLAGFSFVYMLMTLTFLLSARKHGWMTLGFFFFFWLAMILWTALFWMSAAGNSVSNGQMWANGAITILAGLIAWYAATAQLTNWTYGKKYLPG
jgi:succinate-acetate transporter protein